MLLDDARAYKPSDKPDFRRYTEEDLGELQTFPVPEDPASDAREKRLEEFRKRQALTRALNEFLVEEGVLATLSISSCSLRRASARFFSRLRYSWALMMTTPLLLMR